MFNLEWEELDQGRALLHCSVEEWNITIARRLDKHVNALFRRLAQDGYTEAFTVSPNPRFCQYMAGWEIGEIKYNGINYWVYKWELE